MKNVTVVGDFFDGTLAETFKKLGYPAKWKAGEKRDLPDEVVTRVVGSGGQITIASPDAKESKIVEGTASEPIDAEKHYQALYKKSPKLTVVFPEGFRDGQLADELAVLGHPAEFGVGEIAVLPKELLDRIQASGALVDSNPEVVAQYRDNQGKHVLKVEQWQAERTKQKEENKRSKETDEHNKELAKEIEMLSVRVLSQTGKVKEATWQRIHELYSRMK